MGDAIMQLVEEAVGSPWVYPALFAFAAVDAFFPLVPSESLVITAGVFAANGEPELVLVILAAAVGAFAGDHVSYFAGRTFGRGVLARAGPGSRRGAVFDWAERTLASRGGLLLVVSRYVPGGRTAMTLSAGTVGYRLRSFSGFVAIAAASWGVYAALVGYVGGEAFEEEPAKGLLVGFALALSVTAVVELVRYLRRPVRA